MKKIEIKFVCESCEGTLLSEVVLFGGSSIFNEMEKFGKKPEFKDEVTYFCWNCQNSGNPKCIDFALKDEKHA